MIIVPKPSKVEGTEKYLVSLKMLTTVIEKYIPINMNANPGIPKYLTGCFRAII